MDGKNEDGEVVVDPVSFAVHSKAKNGNRAGYWDSEFFHCVDRHIRMVLPILARPPLTILGPPWEPSPPPPVVLGEGRFLMSELPL